MDQKNQFGSENDIKYMMEKTRFNINLFIESITRNSSTAYVFFGDIKKNIYYISDNMRDKFGFPGNIISDLVDRWEERIFCAEGREYYRKTIEELFTYKTCTHDLRYRVRDCEGKVLWVRCYSIIQWNEDQTEPVFLSGRISTQDEHYFIDPVSGLPGGSMLLRNLEHIKTNGCQMPVIGFCLNHMEKINALQGRTYGDRLIHDIAYELQKDMVEDWTFYRLDGMRFAAISKHDELNIKTEIDRMRGTICDIYDKMGVPLEQKCFFTAMEYPMESLTPIDFQENLITMIRYARVHPEVDYVLDGYNNIYQGQVIANSEMLLYQNIKDGMQDFRAVIQPIISTETGEVIGGETLIRWKLGKSDVSPAIFIPVLEKSPLITTVGRWIFGQAVKFCSEVVKVRPSFYLNVNVSLQQLGDDGLIEYMDQCLRKYALSGEHICVELTESCMDQEPEKLVQFVRSCEAMGISIALDDFGSGYSSMRVLMKYPSKVIKLDRSLLLEMTESEEKLNFISSIVYACHKFGKRVCIEGVETEKQKKMAVDAGCDMIQGFYYYRPQELDSMRHILHLNACDAS